MFRYAVVSTDGNVVSIYQGSKKFIECPEYVTDTDYFYSIDESRFVKKSSIKLTVEVYGLSALLKGIPNNSIVMIEGNETTVKYNELEVEFEVEGTYVVEVVPPKEFYKEELEVTVG